MGGCAWQESRVGTVGKALMARARRWPLDCRATPKSSVWPPCPPPLTPAPYLAVQAQEDEHHEEQGGPQRGERHHGDSLGVSDEGQPRAWGGKRERKVLGGVHPSFNCYCNSS